MGVTPTRQILKGHQFATGFVTFISEQRAAPRACPVRQLRVLRRLFRHQTFRDLEKSCRCEMMASLVLLILSARSTM